MSRYDWSKAPEWARYAATDDSGCSFWYQRDPVKGHGLWHGAGGRSERMRYAEWAESLESRPGDAPE
jgi:hypothetical protein